MKQIRHKILAALALVTVLLVPMAGTASAAGYDLSPGFADSVTDACKGIGLTGGDCAGSTSGNSLNKIIAKGVNILSAVVGAVAVIMIIYGGFKYITASGDASKLASARSTIIYAIIGLIIVALAQVIVHFVIKTSAT